VNSKTGVGKQSVNKFMSTTKCLSASQQIIS